MTTPASTYRLQITRDFTLDDAAELTDYLTELGVGAVYLSPVLQSTIGSDHGYDTTDPTRIDRDRGGEAGFDHLLARARAAGLGVVVDIVPNHLGISAPVENPAWWDVLRLGRESAYADWFDIEWSRGRIVVPVLGDDQTLTVSDGELRYFDHRFPLAPGSWREGDDRGHHPRAAALRARALVAGQRGAELPPLLRRDDAGRRTGRGRRRAGRDARPGA